MNTLTQTQADPGLSSFNEDNCGNVSKNGTDPIATYNISCGDIPDQKFSIINTIYSQFQATCTVNTSNVLHLIFST